MFKSEFNNEGKTSWITAIVITGIILLPFWVLYKIVKSLFKKINKKNK